GRLRKPIGLRESCQFHPRDLQIETPRHSVPFHGGQASRPAGKPRKSVRQAEIESRAPQPEGTNQSFSLRRRVLFCRGEIGRRLGVKCLFSRLIELVESAG